MEKIDATPSRSGNLLSTAALALAGTLVPPPALYPWSRPQMLPPAFPLPPAPGGAAAREAGA
eukprot:scaffold44476_cov72-Phaeocystis_antarctica.AAC.1